MSYTYKTRGVCASVIEFELNDGIVSNVSFRGGCNGNLKAVSKLVEGMEGKRVVEILKGNICGFKNTSCADQLAIAIEKALLEQGE
ncbi:MAG: TIGR03905 family TSCPD domain-containing protein [Clostridia bacterium]|nr:TIGR03905 family TSCPD domain-containing protein [Clostridia bacterium]